MAKLGKLKLYISVLIPIFAHKLFPLFLKTRFFIIIILVCTVSHSFAQHHEFLKLKDTFLSAMKQKPNLTAYLDGRSTLVNGFKANVFGAFVGYSYARRVDLGLAYYKTAFSTPYDAVINKGTPIERTETRVVNFDYLAAKIEYTFYKTKHWEFAVPLSIGLGNGHILKMSNDTLTTNLIIAPIETGITGIYLFYDWIGISAGLTYRLNLTRWDYFNEFTAMNYTGGISIRFGSLWRHVKKGPKHWYRGCSNSCCLF